MDFFHLLQNHPSHPPTLVRLRFAPNTAISFLQTQSSPIVPLPTAYLITYFLKYVVYRWGFQVPLARQHAQHTKDEQRYNVLVRNNKMQLLFIRKLVYQVLVLNTKQIGRMDTGKIYFAIPLVLFSFQKLFRSDKK